MSNRVYNIIHCDDSTTAVNITRYFLAIAESQNASIERLIAGLNVLSHHSRVKQILTKACFLNISPSSIQLIFRFTMNNREASEKTTEILGKLCALIYDFYIEENTREIMFPCPSITGGRLK